MFFFQTLFCKPFFIVERNVTLVGVGAIDGHHKDLTMPTKILVYQQTDHETLIPIARPLDGRLVDERW